MAPHCSVAHIEVTQAIQDLEQSVPLIAHKETVVRVFLDTSEPGKLTVCGEIEVLAETGSSTKVASRNKLLLDPAANGKIEKNRLRRDGALNFKLPDVCTASGNYTIRLDSIRLVNLGDAFAIDDSPEITRPVKFLPTPHLRLRILGIRFTAGYPEQEYEPREIDYQLIESWLRRAFPVPRIELTRAVINWETKGPLTSDVVNTWLNALRNDDVSRGGDPLFHYYALVGDGGLSPMRGATNNIPTDPSTWAVSCGPAGQPSDIVFSWDDDDSYGDWYCGHELGHALGRKHVGLCGGAPDIDPHYPFPPDAHLTDREHSFAGFDVGDDQLNLPMRAYSGLKYTDVMSYCNYIWISAYNYIAMRDRLILEASAPRKLRFTPKKKGPKMGKGGESMGRFLNIVGSVNLTRRTGTIDFVNPMEDITPPAGRDDRAIIRLYNGNRSVIDSFPSRLMINLERREVEDDIAVLDSFVPALPETRVIELEVRGERAAIRESGPDGEFNKENLRYSVLISEDGETWRTIAVGRRSPEYVVRKGDIPGATRLRRRVLATDGFLSRIHSEDEIIF